jgi:hypothetical protein
VISQILKLIQTWFERWKKWPVLLRGIFAVFVVLQFIVFFKIEIPAVNTPQARTNTPLLQFLTLQEEDQFDASTEQALLFDSAPLFIPTQWNNTQRLEPVAQDAELKVFDDFEPEIDLMEEMTAAAILKPKQELASNPLDLLEPKFQDLFLAYGQVNAVIEPLEEPSPKAYFRGVRAAWESLPQPKGLKVLGELPGPVGFFVHILEPGVLARSPILSKASGLAEFDLTARAWVSLPEVLAQLPMGYNEIMIFP